jgi:hypothetical protein
MIRRIGYVGMQCGIYLQRKFAAFYKGFMYRWGYDGVLFVGYTCGCGKLYLLKQQYMRRRLSNSTFASLCQAGVWYWCWVFCWGDQNWWVYCCSWYLFLCIWYIDCGYHFGILKVQETSCHRSKCLRPNIWFSVVRNPSILHLMFLEDPKHALLLEHADNSATWKS